MTWVKKRSPEFQMLWGYSTGFLAVWNAHLGRAMGIFAAIASGQYDRAGLAKHLGMHFAALDSWCAGAIAYGFISENRVSNRLEISAKMVRLLLHSADEENLGGQFSYLALKSLDYGSMPNLFKHSKTIPITANAFDAIENATEWDHYGLMRELRLNQDLSHKLEDESDFLDLGCGTGTFLLKLAQAFPKCKFTGIDSSVLAVRRARQKLRGMGIVVKCARAEKMNFHSRFDILHIGEALYAAADKNVVLTNCYAALRPSGRIIIIEGLLPEGAAKKFDGESAVIRGMQLDFALHGHQFMTQGQIKNALGNAGFGKVKIKDLGGRLYMITATK